MNCFGYDLSPDFSYLLLPPYGKVPCASLASKSSWETVTQEFGWTGKPAGQARAPGLDDARRLKEKLRQFAPQVCANKKRRCWMDWTPANPPTINADTSSFFPAKITCGKAPVSFEFFNFAW